MVCKLYKIGAGPLLRPRELRIGHEDEKMEVSIKNDCQGEGESFPSHSMAYSGLTVENGVLWKTFFSR